MTQFLRLAAASPVRGLRMIMGPLFASGDTSEPPTTTHALDVAEPWAARDSGTALDRVEL